MHTLASGQKSICRTRLKLQQQQCFTLMIHCAYRSHTTISKLGSLTHLIVFAHWWIYMPTIVSGTIQLTYLCLTKQSKQPNKPHRIRRRLRKKFRRTKKYRRRPKPKHSHHVVLTSHKIKRKTDEPEQPPVSYDTDGIPFIIDNSATCILCNVCSLFIGKLKA